MISIVSNWLPRRVNLRTIALPTEHGGWGFLLEPIALGLLVAPTWNGLLFGLAMIAVFLVHQPLKIAVKDRLRGTRVPRTIWAERVALFYLVLAALFALPALLTARPVFFVPLAMMLPLILIQTIYDFRGDSRHLVPEVTGALALGGSVAAITLLNCWTLTPALMLWGLLAARIIPSILMVRSVFRLQRNKPAAVRQTYIAHIAALVLVWIAAVIGQASWLAALLMIILIGRAHYNLQHAATIQPKQLGFRELGFGVLTVILLALGMIWAL